MRDSLSERIGAILYDALMLIADARLRSGPIPPSCHASLGDAEDCIDLALALLHGETLTPLVLDDLDDEDAWVVALRNLTEN